MSNINKDLLKLLSQYEELNNYWHWLLKDIVYDIENLYNIFSKQKGKKWYKWEIKKLLKNYTDEILLSDNDLNDIVYDLDLFFKLRIK